ncbi:MAG: hypothetical protein HYY93_01825 [Planctomycetes bacterium]|nr:hypothetical protein [Planctomycetota bacterium]
MRYLALCWLGLALAGLCGVIRANDEPPPPPPAVSLTEGARVYYGDRKSFKAPAQVDAAAVFGHIKEYREIRERKLTSKDPEYWLLIEKANRRFYRAVKKAAKAAAWDLVAEKGSFHVPEGSSVPDGTQDVIDAVDNGDSK